MRSSLIALALLAPAAHAGVTINEVYFDPDSAGGDAGYEWFELYNDTGVAIDLNGWSVEAGTSSFSNVITFGTVSVPANGYLLVGDAMVANTDVQSVMSLGNASSSGDAIRLVDGSAAVVDVVVYGPDNSDGWLDESGSAVTTTAAAGSSGTSIGRLPDGEDTGDLSADFGILTSPTPGASNGTPPACEASTGTVVINEFLADPTGTDSTELREFVELYSSSAVDLEGWSIERFSQADNYSQIHLFGPSDTIAASGHFLLGEANVTTPDAIASGTLGLYAGTGGDGVRLLDCEGTVVDTVVYGTANDDSLIDDTGSVATSLAPDPGGDEALARTSDGADTDASGVDFVIATTPTPGTANPVVQPPSCTADPGGVVTINEFMVNPDGTDSDVLLEFVELHSTQAVDLEGWRLERFSQFDSFSTVATLATGDAIAANSWFVVGEANVSGADHVTSAAMGLYGGSGGDGIRLVDCENTVVDTVLYGGSNDDGLLDDLGNVATSIAAQPGSNDVLARREDGIDTDDSGEDFWVTNQATAGADNPTAPPPPVCTPWDGLTALVINEFLSDPAGADGEALAEWIEIYNPASTAIDMEGWGIERFSQVDNHSLAISAPSATTIPAGGYLVFGEANVSEADVVASSTIGLYTGTGGDGLRLVDCEGTVLDTVVYGDANDDGLIDDNGTVATSLAPKPGSDQAVARKTDGVDTDQSGEDFALASTPTPGAANPEIICVPSDGNVVLNEILTNPSGTDSDAASEFVELYNNSGVPATLDGWGLIAGGQDDDTTIDVVLPPETSIPGVGFFVVGNFNVEEADYVEVFALGNGSGGDFVRLVDCEGTVVDTVIYGADNADGIVDDVGQVPDPPSPNPGDDQSLGRDPDGIDTNSVDDWVIRGTPSPGATNYLEPFIPDDDSGGCGRNRDPGAGGEPGGCAVMPLGGAELAVLSLIAIRRRRRD